MNQFQAVWFEQVKSDHQTLLMLLKQNANPCQVLHYAQMVTEKIGKAYYWRDGRPPPKSHRRFVRFLQALDGRSKSDRERIAALLGFPSINSFQTWIARIKPLADELEKLAPAIAGDTGPNTEYPWPSDAPVVSPANHSFPIWNQLSSSGSGKQFLRVLNDLIIHFPQYA